MSLINKCSIFSQDIEQILFENKIVNWLGWEWGFNFSKFFEDNIEVIKWYLPGKGYQLFKDIERLSYFHDIFLLVNSSKIEFYFANYIFARDVYKLLRWAKKKWVWRFICFSICLTLFILLNREWKKYSRHTKI